MKNNSITLLMFIVPCLLFTITSCSQSSQEDYAERANQILTFVDQGKYQEALLACDKFIASYPRSSLGYSTKGHIFKRLNRAEDSIHFYREALVYINPKKHRSRAIHYGLIGDVYFNINELEQALDFYDRAIKEDPELSSLYTLDVAHVYILKGELAKARSIYTEAIRNINGANQLLEKVSPKNKGTIYGKAAVVAFQLEKDREALDFSVKYNDAHRNDASKLFYAVYLAKLGYKEKARQEFGSINLQNCDYGSLADYYLNMGEKRSAMDAFSKSYEEQKTPDQLTNWKKQWQQESPRDAWNTVRNESWFSDKVYK